MTLLDLINLLFAWYVKVLIADPLMVFAGTLLAFAFGLWIISYPVRG